MDSGNQFLDNFALVNGFQSSYWSNNNGKRAKLKSGHLKCLLYRLYTETWAFTVNYLLLLEWQSVTVTLLPIPERVTLTADHCRRIGITNLRQSLTCPIWILNHNSPNIWIITALCARHVQTCISQSSASVSRNLFLMTVQTINHQK